MSDLFLAVIVQNVNGERRTIRDSWFEMIDRGTSVLAETDTAGIPDNHFHKPTGPHVAHCFEILRQAIQCFSDPSLEPIVEEDGVTLSNMASGWASVHICRDMEKLEEWVSQHGPPPRGS